jgi:hypothetical protein
VGCNSLLSGSWERVFELGERGIDFCSTFDHLAKNYLRGCVPLVHFFIDIALLRLIVGSAFADVLEKMAFGGRPVLVDSLFFHIITNMELYYLSHISDLSTSKHIQYIATSKPFLT